MSLSGCIHVSYIHMSLCIPCVLPPYIVQCQQRHRRRGLTSEELPSLIHNTQSQRRELGLCITVSKLQTTSLRTHVRACVVTVSLFVCTISVIVPNLTRVRIAGVTPILLPSSLRTPLTLKLYLPSWLGPMVRNQNF